MRTETSGFVGVRGNDTHSISMSNRMSKRKSKTVEKDNRNNESKVVVCSVILTHRRWGQNLSTSGLSTYIDSEPSLYESQNDDGMNNFKARNSLSDRQMI